MKEKDLDINKLKLLLEYDSTTGIFTWNKRLNKPQWNSRFAGKRAGYFNTEGYRRISILSRHHFEQRLAWAYSYGAWPEYQVDHINGNPGDNRLCNLASVTQSQNQQAQAIRSDNVSGYTGVYFEKQKNKWVARITIDRKDKYLGSFEIKEDAYKAYLKAKSELHRYQPAPRDYHFEGSKLLGYGN